MKDIHTLLSLYSIFNIRVKKKPKLTEEEIKTLNWGEIERRLGIDASEEPSKKMKLKIIKDSVFARECKWFTKKDMAKWLKQGDKILKSFNQTFKRV